MKKSSYILIILFLAVISGCISSDRTSTSADKVASISITPAEMISPVISNTDIQRIETLERNQSHLLIINISENLTIYQKKNWSDLYLANELDCSRMSTYFWDYVRTNYHIAPKIIVSYERQHAWLALKVSDVGNSSYYIHWNIKGIDYYYLESTIPKLVADDNKRFLINDRPYTSAEFYNATIYIFDTPQDANDFHAENSMLGGWNQEFRLRKDDLDKIERLLGAR